jgi:hypothetical protein
LTTVGTTLEFPRSMDLLDDPDIWIADSGCSAHCTGHKHGMIDVQEHERGQENLFICKSGLARM